MLNVTCSSVLCLHSPYWYPVLEQWRSRSPSQWASSAGHEAAAVWTPEAESCRSGRPPWPASPPASPYRQVKDSKEPLELQTQMLRQQACLCRIFSNNSSDTGHALLRTKCPCISSIFSTIQQDWVAKAFLGPWGNTWLPSSLHVYLINQGLLPIHLHKNINQPSTCLITS